jgi:hypothetical protein
VITVRRRHGEFAEPGGPSARAATGPPGGPAFPWPEGEPLADVPCSQLTDEQMNAFFERLAELLRREADSPQEVRPAPR